MKKIGLILIALSILSLGVSVVSADVPNVTSLGVEVATDGRTLSITVRHSSPSNIHYISKLEVKVGDNVEVVDLDPQSTTSFTEEVSIATSGSVEVRAYCTLHGWSSWASLGETPSEPSGGIPGFPLLAVGLGLALLLRRAG
jgi:desulfoferrodoxin (superoxide reductase-like protein)